MISSTFYNHYLFQLNWKSMAKENLENLNMQKPNNIVFKQSMNGSKEKNDKGI